MKLVLNIKAVLQAAAKLGIENARQLSLATGINYYDCYQIMNKGEAPNVRIATVGKLGKALNLIDRDVALNTDAIREAAARRGIENARQLSIATGVNYHNCYYLFKGESLNVTLPMLAGLTAGLKLKLSEICPGAERLCKQVR